MQVGRIDAGYGSETHHVTNCIHDRQQAKADVGLGMRLGSLAAAEPGEAQQSFSLSAWLADPLKQARQLFGRVWNGGSGGKGADAGQSLSPGEQVMAQLAEDMVEDAASSGGTAHGMAGQPATTARQSVMPQAPANALSHPQIAAAAAMQPQGNPYFAVENAGAQKQDLGQKMRARFAPVADFLAKRFPFAGKNPFQAKHEQPKEDLRKRSHYRSDDLDIDCVLTDDSYLLDSYDRKGGYSQLSTRK